MTTQRRTLLKQSAVLAALAPLAGCCSLSAASSLKAAGAENPAGGKLGPAGMPLQPIPAGPRGTSARKVAFKNDAVTLVGNLYLPPGFNEANRYPAILLMHPAGAVKEQMTGLYAGLLAAEGFAALAFDGSCVGESGGTPRTAEDPFRRMEDIHCAVDFLTTLSFIDDKRIGALGICAGGGYVMAVTPSERRIRAAVGISLADIGSTNREGWLGGATIEEQIAKLEAVSEQRTKEARGAPIRYTPIAPDDLKDLAAARANPALRGGAIPETFLEAYDYYRTPRGMHPNSVNRMTFVSGDKKMLFSTINETTKLFTQPALFIVGERADSRRFSERIYRAIPSKHKEIYVIAGASHVDLYDRPQCVSRAAAKAADFFRKAFGMKN